MTHSAAQGSLVRRAIHIGFADAVRQNSSFVRFQRRRLRSVQLAAHRFRANGGDQMSQFFHSRLLAATLLLSGCFCLATSAAASDVDAAGYYKLRCASCHGANGEGTRNKSPSLGPPLRGNPLVINAPAEKIKKIIHWVM